MCWLLGWYLHPQNMEHHLTHLCNNPIFRSMKLILALQVNCSLPVVAVSECLL